MPMWLQAVVLWLSTQGTTAQPEPNHLMEECVLRHLAYNFSQSLLPSAGRVEDDATASALQIKEVCGDDFSLYIRPDKTTAITIAQPLPDDGCTFYVATTGSDSTGTGSITAPFATLAKAQQHLRQSRDRTTMHCTVYVRGGTYYLAKTFALTPADSNTSWLAMPGDAAVTLSGGLPIPFSSFKPLAADGKILVADVSKLNLSTITPPRSSKGQNGPANRLFVNDKPQVWARYPDAPPSLPECALKIPLGRVGLSTPPRVGFTPSPNTPSWNPAVVADYSWMIPTVGSHPKAYYPDGRQNITNYPNWSSPEWNGGAARSGFENAPLEDESGMTPCYWDEVGGPFSRFEPPIGHGAPRTRTVTVAPVGVVLSAGSPFSDRMENWTEVEFAVVQSMHWWHNVKCDGPVDGPDAQGTVDCTSVKSGNWPGGYGEKHYGGPGPGDGYWGSWAWQIKSVDAIDRRITFGSGGSQTTRGALNAGPWYVEGVREEITAPGEWVHSLAEQKVYFYPNITSADDNSAATGAGEEDVAVVAASLEQIVAVQGTQSNPVTNVRISGFNIRHSASHYTGPYPTCGGGDFCAARTGSIVVTGGFNVSITGLDIDHPGGNAVAIIDYNRGVTVANCSIRYVGEVGFVVQGSTDGIDATAGNYPVGTQIHHNFVYEVATKMRGGSFFFQSLSAQTDLHHNVALNGPRAGINFNDGMGGGNNVHHNLVANFVRESADHGNENSWDRVPFITTFNNGTQSLVPEYTRNHHNFWLMPNLGLNIDHDDGSSFYNDSYNVLIGGGGWTKHSGTHQMAVGNIWYQSSGACGAFAPRAHLCTVCASFSAQNGVGPFADNICINYDSNHEPAPTNSAAGGGSAAGAVNDGAVAGGSAATSGGAAGASAGTGAGGARGPSKSLAWNNSFYNAQGNVSINGGTLAAAQADGLEEGSTAHTFDSLGMSGIVTMIRDLLEF